MVAGVTTYADKSANGVVVRMCRGSGGSHHETRDGRGGTGQEPVLAAAKMDFVQDHVVVRIRKLPAANRLAVFRHKARTPRWPRGKPEPVPMIDCW